MQLRKTPCIYHPEQSITNFCKDRNCLMPLCPSCIRDHSIYHQENQTKPAYFNIYEVLSNVQSDLFATIYALEQNKNRNSELIRRIQTLDGVIKERLLTTKTMMYSLIDEAFNELETELKSQLARLHEEIGLFSVKKSEKYEESFAEILNDLYNINDGLKSEKYLGNIIIFLKDKFQEGNTFNNKINSYLEANEAYQPRIEVSNQAKAAILSNVGRLLKIEGKKDLDRKKQKMQTKTIFKAAKPVAKDYSQKSQKIQRSYTPQKSASYIKTTTAGQTSSRTKLLNSPYKDRLDASYRQYVHPLTPAPYPNTQTTRITNFRQDFQILSKRVSQMKKENEFAKYK